MLKYKAQLNFIRAFKNNQNRPVHETLLEFMVGLFSSLGYNTLHFFLTRNTASNEDSIDQK